MWWVFQDRITDMEQKKLVRSAGGGGYLVQKTLQGCAANMGSKISLLVYGWPFIKCKIWYMNGSIFQNLAKFEPKLGQI